MPDALDTGRSALALEILAADEDAFVALDGQFRFLYVNPAAERLFGKTMPELLGQSLWDAFPATLGTPVEAACRRALTEGVTVTVEHRDPAGQKWFEVRATPSAAGDLFVRFRDLTDRKRADEAVRSAALFPQENPLPVLRVACDGTLLFSNRAAAPLLAQWQCEDGQRVPPVVQQAVETTLAERAPRELEIQSGDRALSFTVTPIADREYANLYGRDVTERERNQQERERLVEMLQESAADATRNRAELEAVFQAMQGGVMVFDIAGNVVLVNEAEARINGFPSAEDMRRNLASFARAYEILHPDGRPLPTEEWPVARVLRGESVTDWELRGRRRDTGQEWDFSFSGQPVYDQQGAQILGVVITRDITKRKRAEAELRRLNAELEERVAAQTSEIRRTYDLLTGIMTGTSEMIATQDAAFRYTSFNQVYRDETKKLYGVDLQVGVRLEEALANFPEDRDTHLEIWRRALAGETFTAEHEFGDPARQRNYYQLHFSPIRDAQGRIVGAAHIGRDITARRRVEEAVQVERQRLHDVLELLPAYVVLLAPDYRVPFANRFFRERFGEARGKRCFEYLFGRTEPCEICESFTVLKTNAPHRWERTGPDGRSYDIFDYPFTDSDSSPLILEMGIDITERKQAEAALREAHKILEVRVQERTADLAQANALLRAEIEERHKIEQALRESQADLNRAQAVARTGSWRLDVRRNELLWSDETHRMFGIPLGTPLTYEAFLAAVHPEDREYVDRSWQAALRGEPYDIEHRILVGDRMRWVRERAELEFDPQGGLLGGFGTAQDVTERKQAEERILHHNALLNSMNRIFSEALTCETEEELGSRCLSVAEEITQSRFGFLAELGTEGRLDSIAISDPGWAACGIEDPTGHRQAPTGFEAHGLYGRVLLDGKGFYTNDPVSHPDRIGTPDGHPPLTAFLGVPLLHAGKTIGVVAVGNREGGYRPQDLEALETLSHAIVHVVMHTRAERAVRAGEERLRQAQKMESIGLLAGGIAHDFNNLLATILGNASLLTEEVPEESAEKLAAVIQATEKAADLTRQLLAYAGKGRFLVEPLDLSRIVRGMTELLRASVPKKVKLRLALASGLPGVEADRGQLQQIVMNLVINAAEAIGANQTGTVTVATKPREVAGTIRIADEITGEPLAPGKYICLEVTDTGYGMDPETRTKIFDPFFTTKFMGRGLGLAAVAGIVQAHHGAIQLETAPGEGAAFRVFLPAGMAPPAPPRRGRQANLRGRESILVVEDEAMVRDFTRAALERYGYQVLEAKSGREAVRMFQQNAERIAAVVLDLMMPVMGGEEVIDLLRSKRADVKVLVMSGYSESEAREMFAGKGASGFLQKPFTATRLAEKVKLALMGSASAPSA